MSGRNHEHGGTRTNSLTLGEYELNFPLVMVLISQRTAYVALPTPRQGWRTQSCQSRSPAHLLSTMEMSAVTMGTRVPGESTSWIAALVGLGRPTRRVDNSLAGGQTKSFLLGSVSAKAVTSTRSSCPYRLSALLHAVKSHSLIQTVDSDGRRP